MPVEVPLPELLEMRMAVAFVADEGPVPDDAALAGMVDVWLMQHAPERIGDAIRSFLGRGLVRMFVEPIAEVPIPPLELLQYMGLDDAGTERLAACSHAVVILGGDLPQPPRMGLWSMYAIAAAVAGSLDGMVVDPDQQRVLPESSLEREIPDDGRVAVADHIVVPVSNHGTGTAWMTTLGMRRFGLPNLEVRDVPLHLTEPMNTLINGIAQALAETVMMHHASRTASDRAAATEPGSAPRADHRSDEWSDADVDVLRIDQLELTTTAVLRAHGASSDEVADMPDGHVTIGLAFNEGGEMEPFIRVHPPGDPDGDMGVWINNVLKQIYGESAPDMRTIDGDNSSLQQARDRAMAELPAVRSRFDAGFPPRTGLFVKVGFEAEDGFREFMWLAVEDWTGTQLVTRLANDPVHRTDLRAGQQLDVAEADVADWLISHPDGTFEGGYTNNVLMEEGEE